MVFRKISWIGIILTIYYCEEIMQGDFREDFNEISEIINETVFLVPRSCQIMAELSTNLLNYIRTTISITLGGVTL